MFSPQYCQSKERAGRSRHIRQISIWLQSWCCQQGFGFRNYGLLFKDCGLLWRDGTHLSKRDNDIFATRLTNFLKWLSHGFFVNNAQKAWRQAVTHVTRWKWNGNRFHKFFKDKRWMTEHHKCPYAKICILGNKQEEIELHV